MYNSHALDIELLNLFIVEKIKVKTIKQQAAGSNTSSNQVLLAPNRNCLE